ncbi:MAG: TlpA disulfide reductase family protein [Pirellulaceae bacterium]|nr:TlpA disulfide reductase family protein [Pirellulaceae bacterium]
MRFDFITQALRTSFTLMLTSSFFLAAPTLTGLCDEKEKDIADTTSAKEKEDAKDKEETEDPFAVPQDASVKELLAWINKVKRTPQPRVAASVTAKKLFPAIIQACDLVIEQSPSDDDFQKAVEEKFSAYGVLSRYSPGAIQDLNALANRYADDQRPKIAQLAIAHLLSVRASNIKEITAENAQKLSDDSIAFLVRFGTNRSTYSPVSTIARSLGYSDHTEIAAVMHERLGQQLTGSDDEVLRKRSSKMVGAARRLRLPGNSMEITGITDNGDTFDWSSYRGKVVLVDFWASWCGPCIAEIPNMKKNLERYGDQGFEIVGINMDSTRAAFEKCVKDKEISWLSIVSEEEGKKGWDAPTADYYGVGAIPTAILVDQQGKVVSLRARGAELDKLLEVLLAAP